MDEMNSKYIEQGWQCPICKAVMSPRERVCVNCKGYQATTFTCNDLYCHPELQTKTISSNYTSQDVRNTVVDYLDEEFNKIVQKTNEI